MRRTTLTAALAASTAVLAAPAAMAADTIYATTASGKLLSFSSDTPALTSFPQTITGLDAGDAIEGLDARPATGQLYLLTSNGTTGKLYTVNPATGGATKVATIDTPLSGTDFGVDFNPAADLLRVVSDTNQNLRLNPNTGVNQINPAMGDPANAPDAPLNTDPASELDVVAAAYTNNFEQGRPATPATSTSGATTLLDVDAAGDRLLTQAPPNTGRLTAVGALGVNVSKDTAFDIAAGDRTAFLAARPEGATGSRLYTVNVATGAATQVGTADIGGGEVITGIAVAQQRPTLYAVDAAGTSLIALRSVNPLGTGNAIEQDAPIAISGLQAGESIVGLDLRPSDGRLYGLGRIGADGTAGRLYVIDPQTGAARRANAAADVVLLPTATGFGVDFNPQADLLRITNDADQNLAVNVDTGAVTPQTALNPGDPSVTASAYENNVPGATSTTLFNLDSSAMDRLTRQVPPASGTQVAVGQLLANAATQVEQTTAENGFDVSGLDGSAFAALTQAGDALPGGQLFRVNLANGTLVRVGDLPTALEGLTVAGAGSVGLAAASATVGEGNVAQVAVTRPDGEGTVTVNYATSDAATSPATAGTDYLPTSGALTFGPGETLKAILVPVRDDDLDEGVENVKLTLTRAAGGYRLGTTEANLAIGDGDATPVGAQPGGGSDTSQAVSPTVVQQVIQAATPGPDRVKPVVLVSVGDLTVRTLRSRGVLAKFSCNEACVGRVQLKLGSRAVSARVSKTLTGPGIASVRLRLSTAGKRAITARSRTRKLTVSAAVVDAAANRTTTSGTFSARR